MREALAPAAGMNIAILGARATGKSWLALELARHQPQVLVTDHPPLLDAAARRSGLAPAALQALASHHRQHFDLTLLTGLDLPAPFEHQAALNEEPRERVDAWLRATLQQAGIAYGVVYGSGPQRLQNALRFISPQDTPPARWRGVCEKCSDPDCELRLFTALRNSQAAAHPAS
jgi:glycine/D-amino acid oxidase-like deaminating enzyme